MLLNKLRDDLNNLIGKTIEKIEIQSNQHVSNGRYIQLYTTDNQILEIYPHDPYNVKFVWK